MGHHRRSEDPFMVRGKKDLTPDEAMEIAQQVTDLTLDAYNNDIREGFKTQSRSAQVGYDITKYLMDKGIIKIGRYDPQRKLEV